MKLILILTLLTSVAWARDSVHFFHSDSCSESKYLASVDTETICQDLSGIERVWGIRVGNGKCANISDMDAVAACKKYRFHGARNNPRATHLYHSDYCNENEYVISVTPRTPCSELAGQGFDKIWGVKVNGKCTNISDTDVVSACRQYRNNGNINNPRATHFFHSDYCSESEYMVSVTPRTKCSDLSGLERVWGIKIGNGECKNISDLDAVKACKQYKNSGNRNNPRAAHLYHSDYCNENEYLLSVTQRTKCSDLGDVERVWGVKIGDKCINISDTDAISACKQFRNSTQRDNPRAVHFYHSDSCSENKYQASVTPRTDCSDFKEMERVWAVKINGKCNNISDMEAVKACKKYKLYRPHE